MGSQITSAKPSRLFKSVVIIATAVSFIGLGPSSLHAEENSEDYSVLLIADTFEGESEAYESSDEASDSSDSQDAQLSSDLTDESSDGVNVNETDNSSDQPAPGYEYCDVGSLNLEGHSSLYELISSEVVINTDYFANVGGKIRGKLSLSTTQAGVEFYSKRFGEIINANCLLLDDSFEGWDAELTAFVPELGVGLPPNDLYNWVFAYYPTKDSELTYCSTECPSGIANLGTWAPLEWLQSGYLILAKPR